MHAEGWGADQHSVCPLCTVHTPVGLKVSGGQRAAGQLKGKWEDWHS